MALSVKRVTSLLTFGLAALSNTAVADQIQNPLRMKINSSVLETLFHKGDQRMFEAFSNLSVTRQEDDSTCPDLSSASYKLTVNDGIDLDSYNFDVSINDETKGGYLGFAGPNLRVMGTAAFGEEHISFEAPVDTFRMVAEFVDEDNKDIIEINSKAQKPSVKEFAFELGQVQSTDGQQISEECAQWLTKGLSDGVIAQYDKLWAGDLDSLANMPVESFLPMILIRHVGGFAMEQKINPEAVEFGFDPEMLFGKARTIPKAKKGMLKEIASEFSPLVNEGENPTMISFIMDENAINSFLLELVLIDRAFSLRDFMRADPRLQEALMSMNTRVFEVIIPSLFEEFGERPFDFYMSMSHSLLSNKLEGVRPTGFQMDKNGNFKFVFNMSITMLVEKKGHPGQWEEARAIFGSFTAKGKVTTNTTNTKGEKMLKIFPKSAEMSQLKIYNKDDEEQELEQMLLTSGFNVQMDALFKMVQPLEMPMKDLPSPPELECLGIALADLGLNFKKGFVEMTCGYRVVDVPSNSALCDTFIDALSEGPKNAKDGVDNLFGGMSPTEYVKDKQRQFEQDYEDLQAKAKQAKESAQATEGEDAEEVQEEQVIMDEL